MLFPCSHHLELQREIVTIQAPTRSPATIDFTITADTDAPVNGIPQLNLIDNDQAKHFPVAHAKVTSHGFQGYASMYRWVQIYAESPQPFNKSSIPWQMDVLPIYNGVNNPFTWFGPEPSLYDAPFRKGLPQIDWAARSFLCYIEDALITRNVIPLAAFEWGFWTVDRETSVKRLERLEVDTWNEHLKLFRDNFTGWTFEEAGKGAC